MSSIYFDPNIINFDGATITKKESKYTSIDQLLNLDNPLKHLAISVSGEKKFKVKDTFTFKNSFGGKSLNLQEIVNNRTLFIKDIQNNISYYNEMQQLANCYIKKGEEYVMVTKYPNDLHLFNEMLNNTSEIALSIKTGIHANNQSPSAGSPHFGIDVLIRDFPVQLFIPIHYREFDNIEKLKNFFKSKKVIITPSSQRSNGFFNREKVIEENYCQILVVRPIDLEKYKKWTNHFIMVLPEPQSGVGYTRFWSQHLAIYLGIEFCWMIDDLVETLFDNESNKIVHWGDQMELMEKTMFQHSDKIGILSIKSHSRHSDFKLTPKIALCQVFILLNIKKLKEVKVKYNRSLYHKEDVLFTIDVLSKGLLTIMYRNVCFTDEKERNTGAQSPTTGRNENYSPNAQKSPISPPQQYQQQGHPPVGYQTNSISPYKTPKKI